MLISMLHRDGEISERSEHAKPQLILNLNASKRGVDSLDKLLSRCSCQRKTSQRPLLVLLQHAGCVHTPCFRDPDATKTRLATWKAPEERGLCRGVRQGTGLRLQSRQHVPLSNTRHLNYYLRSRKCKKINYVVCNI